MKKLINKLIIINMIFIFIIFNNYKNTQEINYIDNINEIYNIDESYENFLYINHNYKDEIDEEKKSENTKTLLQSIFLTILKYIVISSLILGFIVVIIMLLIKKSRKKRG